MKNIMKTAVNRVYTLLEMKESDPDFFKTMMLGWAATTSHWDEPELLDMRSFRGDGGGARAVKTA